MTTDTTSPDTPDGDAPTVYDKAKAAADAADHAANKAALDEALLGKPTPSTPGKPGNGSRKPASRTKAKPATKGAKAKAAGSKPAAKKNTKPTKGKAAKLAAPSTGKRKDEPIKGELKGATLTNYEKVLKAIPAKPGEALNANQIAKRVNFWPIPCKRYLETAVDRGDAKKATDGSKVTYYKGADKKGKGGS